MASFVVLAALAPGQAAGVNPEVAVGGAGSKWFSGSLLQQSGLNCTILGGSYSETMVSAIAGYGGAPNGGVVRVGDRYYASLLVSIPGNPCGSGSAIVGTDLVLPRGTSVDTSAQIRCFGKPRTSNDFIELTGGSWNFLNSSGPYCPAQVGGSLTGTSGAVGVGYRPLANAQMYQLFVPIKSSQTLDGAARSPADEIRWVLSTSGTYSNTGATYVWTNVFPAGTATGNTPFIYFARNPSAEPYWSASTPGAENRVEWFANLYSAGLAGEFCWALYAGTNTSGTPVFTCDTIGGWNKAIPAGPTLFQVEGQGGHRGPNGGYAPLVYDPSETATIVWSFDPTGPAGPVYSEPLTFTALAGPDSDGDGVPNASDACPNTKGTLGNGCQPDPQQDPDGDGVFGSADKCPAENGAASPDGCPANRQQNNDDNQQRNDDQVTRDLDAPVANAFGVTPRKIRAAARGASVAAPIGGTVRYRLSEAAGAGFKVERARPGRRAGSRCVAQTRRNRRARKCTRFVVMPGSFSHDGALGDNQLRFTGRLGGRKLPVGSYRLVLTPTDAAGNAGAAVRAPFQIVRR